jgi:hypothetical protein
MNYDPALEFIFTLKTAIPFYSLAPDLSAICKSTQPFYAGPLKFFCIYVLALIFPVKPLFLISKIAN